MRRNSTKTLLMAAGLFALGCGDQEEARIGAVLPLTGEHRVYGEESRRGLELALAELRAAGETRLALTVVDSASDPRQARELLSRLYDEGALAAVGGLTPREARAMAPVAEDFGRVLLSPSATLPVPGEGTRHFYSLAASPDMESASMATFASQRLGVGTAVLIGEAEAATKGFMEGFRAPLVARGGGLLASFELPLEGADVTETVRDALGHEPDAVCLVGYEATVAALLRELRSQGYAGKILTTQTFASPSAIRRTGDDARGVLLTHTVFEPGEAGSPAAEFAERYLESYGEMPGIFAAEGYDALKVLAAALADRPALPSEVRKGLSFAVKDFPGVTGSLQFDEARSVSKIPRVYEVAADLSLRDHGRWLDDETARIEKLLAEIRDAMAAASTRPAAR